MGRLGRPLSLLKAEGVIDHEEPGAVGLPARDLGALPFGLERFAIGTSASRTHFDVVKAMPAVSASFFTSSVIRGFMARKPPSASRTALVPDTTRPGSGMRHAPGS